LHSPGRRFEVAQFGRGFAKRIEMAARAALVGEVERMAASDAPPLPTLAHFGVTPLASSDEVANNPNHSNAGNQQAQESDAYAQIHGRAPCMKCPLAREEWRCVVT
jgi:hypothetical protein